MTSQFFQCIGDDLRGYFVEPKYAGDTRMWIVPGTYRDDPSKPSAETQARALGWMTEEERHGVNDHHGVVHPDGYWAPDWQAACVFLRPVAV